MADRLDIRKVLGAWLRQVRNEKGLTQEEVAELAGVSTQYYSEVERGVRNITVLNVQRLLVGLEVNKEEVVKLLRTADMSDDEAAIIELVARLFAHGTKKAKRQVRGVLTELVE
jgi:XRE family transcriptional regulator, regulator of sulfur utilization